MNRTELREKLNKIDCDNCNQYDLVNLFESVKLSNEDLNKLSEMVEDKDIHDFLYSKLNIAEGGWYGSPREKSYYYQADYHLPDYFYSQTVYDIPSSEIGDDVELSIKKYIADQEGYGEDEEYIDGIEVWNIREYDDDGDFVDESLRIEESMSSAVERQTLGYKKTKGQIQCNGGAQAKEVEDLLKAKYDNVTTQKGKGGKVIIKFSKNESLGEDFYDDEYDDFELASIYGGDFTYCPVCGARMEYDEDGDHYCPKCKKSGHTLSLIRRGFIKDDNESLSESSNGYFAYHDQIVDALIARCQREGVLSTNSKTLLNQLAEILGVEQEDIEDESHIDINELIAFCQRQDVLPTTSDELIDDLESLTDLGREDIEGLLDESLSESEDIQSRIDELEERIQKLVKRYQSAQKQYHGDSSLSKRIEAEISGLEDEQRKLKSKLHTEESLSEAYKLRVGYKDKETNRTYSREYPYNGETDKKNINWLKDADKIAFDNCAPNEDVLGYNLVEVGENESLSEAQERQAKIEVRKVYSWYDVYVDNVLLLKKLSEEDAKEIMKTMDDNNYPYIYRETEESKWADAMAKEQNYYVEESVTEDTIKQGSQWVNKGKEGTHGKFKTKKAADAQRKAMFARGFKEGVEDTNNKKDPNTLPDDYVLFNSNVTNYTDEEIDLYYDCIREFCYIDEIDYDDLEVTFITNKRDADDWDEKTYTASWEYHPDDYKAEEYANDYLTKKYPKIITVGDIKKSADDVHEYVKSMFWEEAQEEAQNELSPADFEVDEYEEQLKEESARDTMRSVVAKWRSRRSNKDESVEDDSSKEKKKTKNIAGIEHL